MKKIVSIILTIVLLVSVFPLGLFGITASAADKYEDLYYSIENNEVYINNCFSYNKSEIVIPETIQGYPVTKIKSGAFSGCYGLVKVVIPNTVKFIDLLAFDGCFRLESVNIPASVSYIGQTAFNYCKALETITVDEDNQTYSSDENGVLFNKDKKNLILCPRGTALNSYTIPNTVTNVSDFAFAYCQNLKSITFSDSVESIGTYVFRGCTNLETANITNNVKSIGIYAFTSCQSLKKVNIPNSISEIPEGMFSSCYKLQNITIPDSVKSIGQRAFSSCMELTGLEIPKGVTDIDSEAFKECESLTSIEIPSGVTNIKKDTFNMCGNLKSIKIPQSVISIDESAFKYCDNITYVWYSGTKQQREAIEIGENNEYLKNAKWYYSACEGEHSYKTTLTKATISKNGKIVKECSDCGNIESTSTVYYPKTFKLSYTSYAYNGKTKTPTVSVKDSKGKTISSKYYTVSYASGRKNVGKYKVTITFKGNYSGTKTLYFTINPKAASINKLTAKSKAITVKLNRSLKQSTGYEIQYSTSKKFTKAKTKKITSYKTTSATLTKLSAKKTYYVRVRTYKTVGKTKYYSNWSSYKYTKTKK